MLKQLSIYNVATFVPLVVQTALLPIFTNYLTPTDYGVRAIVLLSILTFQVFSDLGTNWVIRSKYYLLKTNYEISVLVSTTLFLSLIIRLIFVILIFQTKDIVFSKVFNTKTPIDYRHVDYNINIKQLRSIVDTCDDGFMSPDDVQKTLDACGIKRAKEVIIHSQEELLAATKQVGFPLVMKVIGPVHKTDVGGVIIDIKDMESALTSMNKLMNIPSAIGVLLQPMLNGVELFAGISREDKFGHMIFFGLGGVFVEMIKDVRVLLTPFCSLEVMDEIKQLRSYKIIEGYRGNEPVNENKFAEIISRLAQLVDCVPEISEMDLNPLLGTKDDVVAVDVRIRLSK